MAPQLVFGTASFGMDFSDFQDEQSVTSLLQTLRDLGISRLDTGARYPPLNHGRSEALIGEARKLSKDFTIDTKVFTDTRNDGSGDLKREAIQQSVNSSLQRLQEAEGVNVIYAHRADPATPLEEQIQNFNEMIAQGHCKAWGVSNTPPAVVERIVQLCEQNGWKKPSCYQGNYNLVTRGMETKLLPILRSHNISFVAFQSLAAGFLTGNFINNQHAGTRFDESNPLGKFVQKIFGAEELHGAMKDFDAGVKAHGLTPIEVAIRWIVHHSALGDEDGVIIGASKTAQVSETVAFVQKGPLPTTVLPLIERFWDAVKTLRSELI